MNGGSAVRWWEEASAGRVRGGGCQAWDGAGGQEWEVVVGEGPEGKEGKEGREDQVEGREVFGPAAVAAAEVLGRVV